MYRILKSNRLIGLHTRNFLKSKHDFRNNQWRTNGHNAHWNYIAFSQRCDLNTYYAGLTLPSHSLAFQRNISSTPLLYDKEPLKSSSKVEDTVKNLKKGLEGEEKGQDQTEVVVKKSLKQRIKEELIHYYHGFRLLGLEIRISSSLVLRIIKGETLSRREHRLLVRTIGDLFRLIPFLVFIVVPFLEFALPIVLKFFPGMLPSTFETLSQTQQKYRQHLKVKLEMAKFFQETLDEMAPQAKDRHSKQAKEFQDFFVRVRQSGEMATSKEIMKFSTLFEDEITLDSLQRQHLVALCRVLNASTLGTSAMLRFNLRLKLRSIAADDKMIAKEGVDSLNYAELQQACKTRGMRAYGVSEERLRNELKNWLDLSLNEKVPQSLLLLSRALMVPDHVPTAIKLKATITALPEQVVTQTKAAIGEKEGKLDFKAKMEAIKLEEAKIKEEKKEREEVEKEKELLYLKNRENEELVDKAIVMDTASTPELRDPAPIIADEKPTTKKEEVLSAKDMGVIEDAIENIAQSKKSLVLEKEGIHELKQEMSDYTEDVKELQEIIRTNKADIKVSKGAKRLYRAVNSMISKMDKVLHDLESKEKVLKSSLEQTKEEPKETKEKLVHIDELMSSIKILQKVPDEAKLKLIQDILGRLDDDFDGQLKVDDVLKMVEIIGNEHVHLSEKQMSELIELMDKEEVLEVESKIQKALDKAAEKLNAENLASRKSLFDMIREAQERKAMKASGQESNEQQSLPTDEMVPKSTSETKQAQRPRNP